MKTRIECDDSGNPLAMMRSSGIGPNGVVSEMAATAD